jgi:hypothetical protein
MFRRGDRNCIEGERRAGPVTERKGEVSTLGPIDIDALSTAPVLYFMEIILEVIGGCGGSILEEWIHVSSAKVARRVESSDNRAIDGIIQKKKINKHKQSVGFCVMLNPVNP